MKSIKKETKQPTDERAYPCLRIFDEEDVIILFLRPMEGVVVYDPDNNYGLGTYDDGWDEDDSKAFYGKVELVSE